MPGPCDTASPGGSSATAHVWLVRRSSNGPARRHGGIARQRLADQPPPLPAPPIGRLRHVFTHFALELAVVPKRRADGEGWWHPIDRLDEAGLPTLYRRAAELVVARSSKCRRLTRA